MRRTVAGIGRTFITLGLLILLFVAYQLWGTDIFTKRAQTKLEHDLTKLTQQVNASSSTSTSSTSSTTAKAATTTTTATPTTAAAVQLPVIKEGDPLGRIIIPKINVNWVFVQGTNRPDLAKGPGHYPSTPLPGQIGNAAIAGHRTTHGAPFYNVNELQPAANGKAGDLIITQSLIGTHVFQVIDVRSVKPTETWVAGPMTLPEQQLNHTGLKLAANKSYLTLTTCNPRYSARERMVILAQLVDNTTKTKPKNAPASAKAVGTVHFAAGSAATNSTDDAQALQDGLSGDINSRAPAFVWGLLALAVGLVWWWAFRRYRHPVTWIGGVVPFLTVLFVCYVYLERTLPANF